MFFSPFSIAITSFSEERANLSAFRTFVPKEWLLANTCPLFKKGDRALACNYRSVSSTSVSCELVEYIVCSNIMADLGEYQLLSDRQHAFRKRHSCETQLTTVINDWVKILDKGGQVDTFI